MYTETTTEAHDVTTEADAVKATVVTVETTCLNDADWDDLSTEQIEALDGREERTGVEVEYSIEVEYIPHASGDPDDEGGWYATCCEERDGMSVWAGNGPVDDSGWVTAMAIPEEILDALSSLAVELRNTSDLCEVCRRHGICTPATQGKAWVEGTAELRCCDECATA